MAKKTLQTLIRLQRTRIDALRKAHNVLLDRQDREQDAITGIAQALEAEKNLAAQDGKTAAGYIGDYAPFSQRMQIQRTEHEANLERLAPEIERSQTALIDAFADRKRFEIIEENNARREKEQYETKQQLEVDELTIVRYRHREKG